MGVRVDTLLVGAQKINLSPLFKNVRTNTSSSVQRENKSVPLIQAEAGRMCQRMYLPRLSE